MMIFGVGTGRCGSLSLHKFLNDQDETVCFHEQNPTVMAWEGAWPSVLNLMRCFEGIMDGREMALPLDLAHPGRTDHISPLERVATLPRISRIGDVASYYLPYVRQMIAAHDQIRFVCLRRDRQATIDSFMRKTRTLRAPNSIWERIRYIQTGYVPTHRNHWMRHDGTQWAKNKIWTKCFPKFRDATDLPDALGRYWGSYYKTARELQDAFPDQFRIFEMGALNTDAGKASILEFCTIPPKDVSGTYHVNQSKGPQT